MTVACQVTRMTGNVTDDPSSDALQFFFNYRGDRSAGDSLTREPRGLASWAGRMDALAFCLPVAWPGLMKPGVALPL